MINYNKTSLNKQNSHKKQRAKSIYNGNKMHTASMNIIKGTAAEMISDFSNIPLKNIINQRNDRLTEDKKPSQLAQKFANNKSIILSKPDQLKSSFDLAQYPKQPFQKSSKSRSNKKLKPFQQLPSQQIKLTSRHSFIEKQSVLGHKNSLLTLQTERYSRDKSFKKLVEGQGTGNTNNRYEKSSASKCQGGHMRLKTDISSNDIDLGFADGRVALFPPRREDSGLNNGSRNTGWRPATAREGQIETEQMIEVSVQELTKLMKRHQQLKIQRQDLGKQVMFYKKHIGKTGNSVCRALR